MTNPRGITRSSTTKTGTAALRKELDRLGQTDGQGRRREYCGYVAFFLAKKLRRAQTKKPTR